MPWSVGDVESHKKGLSDEQKKRWVAVANSVLAKCVQAGGTDKTCAPSAIRQANGVVGNETVPVYFSICNNYKVRDATHKKKKYLVVPVVMMVEGVHNGSHGRLLHPMDELGKFPEAWNGIPVVIHHPQREGQNVSANSPDVIDERAVGVVYNTQVDGKKLKCEAWLDEEKLQGVSEAVLSDVKEGRPIEVSVGVFTEDELVTGEWNGETYEAIAHNHRPDHLALLPGGTGACSIEDGCGLGANANKKGGLNVNDEEVGKMIETLSLAGYAVNEIGDHTKQGFKETMDAVYGVLRAMDGKDKYHYLEELYPEHMVYQVNTGDGVKMYKQEYAMKDGKIELNGTPVEVRKKVDYTAVTTMARLKFNNNQKKEDLNMADEKCTECVKKKVDALIANSNGKYTETDRPWLETLEEVAIDKIAQPIEKVVEKKVEVPQALTANQLADLEWAASMRKEKRDGLIRGIQDNSPKDSWTADELAAFSDTQLEKILGAIKKDEMIYVPAGGQVVTHGVRKVKPLLPTGMEQEEPKK